jgi:glycosyltransferase involved in cell wall biosynthesis
MASNTPVITYNLPELLEVWKDKVVYIPLGNKRKFAQSVLSLISSPLDRKRIAKKAKEFVTTLDWKNVARNELKVIEGVKR